MGPQLRFPGSYVKGYLAVAVDIAPQSGANSLDSAGPPTTPGSPEPSLFAL